MLDYCPFLTPNEKWFRLFAVQLLKINLFYSSHRSFQSSTSSSRGDASENIVFEEQFQNVLAEQLKDYDTIDSLTFANVFNKVQLHASSSDQDVKFTGNLIKCFKRRKKFPQNRLIFVCEACIMNCLPLFTVFQMFS